MAQTYTLDEAAERLGITTSELKRRLREDWKTLKSFRDGPTLRFRSTDIDELARSMGAASEPDLPLAAMDDSAPGSDDFKLHGSDDGTPVDEPLVFGSSDDDIFSLSSEEKTPSKPAGKPDSDVRLEPSAKGQAKPDSDVRLEPPKAKSGKDSSVVPTEELSLDFSGPGSAVIKGGSSAKLSAPKSSSKLTGDSGKSLSNKPNSGDSSEFELSLDADSDDFELQLNTDSSDEVDLGAPPLSSTGKPRAGESGINLRDPADSGISLEKKSNKGKGKPPVAPEDDSDDFELSLDPGPSSGAGRSGPPSTKMPRPEPITSDSDSEFELTLDDSGGTSSLEHAALEDDDDKNDIFETDFEIPPMSDDSGSEAVELESDTDLETSDELALDDSDVLSEDDESASQVVMLDDEESVDVDLSDVEVEVEEEEDSVSAALVGVKNRTRHEEDEDEEPVVAGVAPAAPWGPLPAIFLLPAFVLVIMGGLVGFELVHTMWGYQQPKKPSTPIVRGIAKTLEMDIKDQ